MGKAVNMIEKKIALLRAEAGLSQEKLAELLDVSRQSVSKWEMGEALPGIDKILRMAELFSVSTDELLRDTLRIARLEKAKKKNRYFGTDGFRGEAGVSLTSMQAYRVGRFLGWYFASPLSPSRTARPRIVIGKDTRRSSYMLEYSLVAGITASGADAYMLHVITTPGVSYVTHHDEFDCGVMITASHNPFYDNGIKVLDRHGEKLTEEVTDLIEAYLDGNLAALGVRGEDLPFASRERLGCIIDHVAGRNRYVGYLISLASNSYKKLRIGLDCANGASFNIARTVFSALGAELYVMGDEPDGLNVNKTCGSTHPEGLQALVEEKHLDVGFAFDGDADRCIAVDECGRIVDGDAVLYILAKRLLGRGMLSGDTVVGTVMSNSGLGTSLARLGIRFVETAVGDRFVYECMQENGYSLGGEQSGHTILRKYATTGDGLLTAIMIAEEMVDTKRPLSALSEGLFLYPQYTENVRVRDKDAVLGDATVLALLGDIRGEIGEEGRVLLRKSGTEPVVRVMVECKSLDAGRAYVARLTDAIRAEGHADE